MTEIKTTLPEDPKAAHESAETTDNLNLDPEVDLAMTQTMSDVDDIVFSAVKGVRRYQIVRAPQEKLDEWKRSVDEIVAAISSKNLASVRKLTMRDGHYTGDPKAVEKVISGEELDDTDIKLLAIGLFVLREKAQWSPVKSGLKMLKGGKFRMESAFEPGSWPNCYDTSVIVNELAKMYGIEGSLHSKGLSHSHFETKEGKVSDPMYGWRRGGIFQTKEKFEKFKKDMGLLRRMGLRKE